MSNYQDHLLFGSVLVLIFAYIVGPYMAYSGTAVLASAAFILLAAVFPDIDHKGSVVHRKLKGLVIILVAGIPVVIAYPRIPLMLVSGGLAALGTAYTFEAVKPHHRGSTHTFRFAVLFAAFVGGFTLYLFGSFMPAVFTFVAYLSHLVLDGTWQ
jgi:membrane-bound metal-dependent hydrolase YbcI (DUF457 family)